MSDERKPLWEDICPNLPIRDSIGWTGQKMPVPMRPVPINTDLKVIPASPGPTRLNFKVYEHIGCEVLLPMRPVEEARRLLRRVLDGGKSIWSITGGSSWCRSIRRPVFSVVTSIDGIKVGDELLMPTLFGFDWAPVTSIIGDSASAENENLLWPMEFGKDDRHAWVSVGCINRQAIERVNITAG